MTEVAAERRRQAVSARAGQGWCMPRPILRFGSKLMTQQVWCWGRDVECPEGNLLMRFGFERYRDREDDYRSTCYRLDRDQLHVSLWGFGMFIGMRELGGLYLDRFDFCPKWAPIESLSLEIHWPDDLPSFTRPRGKPQWERAHRLWRTSLKWIADYEAWVKENVGLAYRRECVESWLRPFVRAEKQAEAWRYLGRQDWRHRDRSTTEALRRFTIRMGAQ